MKVMTTTVLDEKHLELQEQVSVPSGTRLRIEILNVSDPGDYASRLAEYYGQASAKALEEERALAEELGASDPSLAHEDPWW